MSLFSRSNSRSFILKAQFDLEFDIWKAMYDSIDVILIPLESHVFSIVKIDVTMVSNRLPSPGY